MTTMPDLPNESPEDEVKAEPASIVDFVDSQGRKPQTPVIHEPSTEARASVEEFKIDDWAKLARWQCPFCQIEVVQDEPRFREHLREHGVSGV